MDPAEQANLLISLGLTRNLARVYLALASSESLTVSEISRAASVRTEIVYRAMPKLQRAGLVEKLVTTPTIFRATPLRDALDILMEQRSHQTEVMQATANRLLEQMAAEKAIVPSQEEPKTILMPGGKRLVHCYEEKVQSATRSLDAVLTGKKMFGWLTEHPNLIDEMSTKKVDVRLIIACNSQDNHVETFEEIQKSGKARIKLTSNEIPTCAGVWDNKEAVISTSTQTAFAQSPAYWTNDPCIVALCQAYFERQWEGKPTENADTC
ncbi:MAG: TrmB family transcriptional regulator [Candidatus Bathyarchaeia archaeon]